MVLPHQAMPTTCLRAQLLFSVPGLARLTDRAASPATLSSPNHTELKTINQSTEICKTAELDGKQALLELSSDIPENMSTPTRIRELAESDTNSDPENLHFSETLGKYVTYLRTIKRPKIVNSELFDGVDRVSRSIERCIKLAESALGSSKTQQNPEALNAP